jgi:hypothetical protein
MPMPNTDNMGKLFPEVSGQVVTVFAPTEAVFRLRQLAGTSPSRVLGIGVPGAVVG